MMQFIKGLSGFSLFLLVVPVVLFFVGSLDLDQTNTFMLLGTLTWFCTAPLWMGKA
jgi:hypothetical protein